MSLQNQRSLSRGQVLPLMRRIDGAPDPLALFEASFEAGQLSLLLESASPDAARADQSIFVARSAVIAECRGREVELRAITANGDNALLFLEEHLKAHALGPIQDRRLKLSFPVLQSEAEAVDGQDEDRRLREPSPLDALRAMATGFTLLQDPGERGYLCAGVMAWDLLDSFETLPEAQSDPLNYPNYRFVLPELLVIIDHRRKQTRLLGHVFGGHPAKVDEAHARLHAALKAMVQAIEETPTLSKPRPLPDALWQQYEASLSDEAYADLVGRLKEHVRAGDVFQVVPSRSFVGPCPNPLGAYQRLREINPSPYMFYMSDGEQTLFGASPETSVQVDRVGNELRVRIKPIAGTRPRGWVNGRLQHDLDNRYEAELRFDEKEQAEHVMLVDLARNDVARVAKPESRRVERFMAVERYSHVMHTVSSVVGELLPGLDALHAVQASLTMGTLTGAPKLRAAELIRETEADKRGAYGGSIGYLAFDGSLDSAIVIRSAFVTHGEASLRAGAGVVYDSDPQLEAKETVQKASAVAFAIKEGGGA